MGTDLTRSEVDMIWTASGFQKDQRIPFANLIRQIIMFNREENQLMIQQCISFRKNSSLSIDHFSSSSSTTFSIIT